MTEYEDEYCERPETICDRCARQSIRSCGRASGYINRMACAEFEELDEDEDD